MKFNQENIENFQDNVNKNEKLIASNTSEDLHYLYPNGHRITHQIRWFKVSRYRDRALRTDIAA